MIAHMDETMTKNDMMIAYETITQRDSVWFDPEEGRIEISPLYIAWLEERLRTDFMISPKTLGYGERVVWRNNG
jgi:hypothetical protein